MALVDIENEILTEKATHPELTPLDSDSNAAIWRLWMFIQASITDFFDDVMALFKSDMQTLIDNNQYGTDPWWQGKMLAFQFGDLLVFQNNIYQYAIVDPTKQIVGFCAITSINGVVQIKVALNVNGQPAVLSDDQKNGVIAYCRQIQPSGARFAVSSLPADLIKFIGNIYYDASGDLSVIQPAVESAIITFLNAKNTTNFDGTLYVNKLIDAIQGVPGVVGNQVDVLSIAAKNSGGVYAEFTSSNRPESGFFAIDPAFPLSSTLTYMPFVA